MLQNIVLVVHIMIAAALVAVILWQRSEGGALGIGGGGGGGFLTGRGTANLLTRTTAGLAAGFFATSILLTILGQQAGPKGSAFDQPAPAAATAPAPDAGTAPAAKPDENAPRGGILDKLK